MDKFEEELQQMYEAEHRLIEDKIYLANLEKKEGDNS